MNAFTKALFLSAMLICPALANANAEVQQFGMCLTDSMNGKERKDLAKWIFLGMSTHSTIKPYAKTTQADLDQSNKFVADLVTRLITEDCPEQARAAMNTMGAAAFEQAFKIVGEVAMQELMTEPSVGQALGGFEKYLDQKKFDEVFGK